MGPSFDNSLTNPGDSVRFYSNASFLTDVSYSQETDKDEEKAWTSRPIQEEKEKETDHHVPIWAPDRGTEPLPLLQDTLRPDRKEISQKLPPRFVLRHGATGLQPDPRHAHAPREA